MEECKWIMVRRETTYDKVKRYFKNLFYKWFGKKEIALENKSLVDTKNIPVKKEGEIIVEIIGNYIN